MQTTNVHGALFLLNSLFCIRAMNITYLLDAATPIPFHAIAAMVAIVLGGVQLSLPKGTVLHRLLGWIWAGVMLMVAISSFFIHEIQLWGAFSPIHLLSIATIVTLVWSVHSAKQGKIAQHRRQMTLLYVFALILTGLFTLAPGRIMYHVIFGG